MEDQGEEFKKKAEKKLTSWGIYGSKYKDAANLFEKACNSFKLAKKWNEAGAMYEKLAECHLKLDGIYEAGVAYADGGHCYRKTNTTKEAVTFFEEAACLFVKLERFMMSARCYKEIAEIFEGEHMLEPAMSYYDKAADYFVLHDVTTSVDQCKQKIAEIAAQLGHYQKAIGMYENLARQSGSHSLLKYGVKGHLFNAGICQLCNGNVDAITTYAMGLYQELDPTFCATREYKLLEQLAVAIDQQDVKKFLDAYSGFNGICKLDERRKTLLLRIRESLKAKD